MLLHLPLLGKYNDDSICLAKNAQLCVEGIQYQPITIKRGGQGYPTYKIYFPLLTDCSSKSYLLIYLFVQQFIFGCLPYQQH